MLLLCFPTQYSQLVCWFQPRAHCSNIQTASVQVISLALAGPLSWFSCLTVIPIIVLYKLTDKMWGCGEATRHNFTRVQRETMWVVRTNPQFNCNISLEIIKEVKHISYCLHLLL